MDRMRAMTEGWLQIASREASSNKFRALKSRRWMRLVGHGAARREIRISYEVFV
jgi:hypothetical protein